MGVVETKWRREITITEAENGYVVLAGKIGFPADEIYAFQTKIDVQVYIKRIIEEWAGDNNANTHKIRTKEKQGCEEAVEKVE